MSNEKPNLDELKLSDDVVSMSKALEKEFKVGEGNLIPTDKETFKRILSEDQVKTVTESQRILKTLNAAAALAVVHVGTEHLKRHKDAQSVELLMPVGDDKLEVTFDRSKTYPARGEGAEPITKHGVLNMSYTVTGAVNQRGSIKKIRQYANDLAASVLIK